MHTAASPARLSPRVLTAALLLSLLSVGVGAQEVLWRYRVPGGHPDGSPAMGDIDGDGARDVVLTTTVGSVIALDAQGFEIWRWDAGQPFSVGPTLADVTGGPSPEVLVLSNVGGVACLDGPTGRPIWTTDVLGKVDWGMSAVVAADTDGDGSTEIITSDSAGMLVCLQGDGKLLWSRQEAGGWTSCAAVGDLDGDGTCEVLIGSGDSPLVCLSHDGEERWRLDAQGAAWTSPVIWDLDGVGGREILTGIGASLAAVSAEGAVLWRHAMSRDIDAAISVADADRDGHVEVYAVDLDGQLACVSHTGELLWQGDVEERSRRSPAIADIDGDGDIEILVGGYSGALHVFDAKGTLEGRIALGAATNATPAVVDLAGSGGLEVVCAVTSGEIVVFQWPPQREAPPDVLWPAYRYTSARSAAPAAAQHKPAVTLTKIDYGGCYVGMNAFTAQVGNPERRLVDASLTVSKDGVCSATVAVSSSSETLQCRVPYSIQGRRAVKVEFVCQVAADGEVVLERRHAEYVPPFVRDLAESDSALAELAKAIPQLPDPSGLEERVDFLRAKFPEYRERAQLAAGLSSEEHRNLCDELIALHTECAQWVAIVRLAVSSEGSRGLVLSAANPWAPFGGTAELVEERLRPPDLLVETFQGEVEAAALNVFNASGRPRTLRILLDALTCAESAKTVRARDVVAVREVVAVPAGEHWIADALPLLNQGGTVVVPAWQARQLWFSTNTSQLAPGTWTGGVRVRALDTEACEAAATMTIRMWDAKAPEQTLRHCNWGRPDGYFGDQAEAALDDMVAHGTNVFVDVPCPAASFDQNGDLVGAIDFDAHDAAVRLRMPGALFLFHSWPLTGPAEPFSPTWKKAATAWLRAWVRHLAEIGVGYEDFALYPIDEPGLRDGLVDAFINYARVAREADSDIRIYTDPVGRANLEDLKRMAPYVDVWCPERRGYFLGLGADKLDFMRSTGKPVWMYACEGSDKLQCPLGYYRGQGWQAWRHGLSGVGWWSWCASAKTWSHDSGYTMVYQGDGVVPSKRWEAVRDGIEDYGMLQVLDRAAEAAAKADRAREAVRAARRLLTEDAAEIADFCAGDEYSTLPGIDGLRGVRPVADRRWQAIQAARRQIAEFLAQLTATEP